MQVPIVFCADANYGQYLPVAIQSIIENSNSKNIYQIILLDNGIKKDDLAVLKAQIVNTQNLRLKVHSINEWIEENKAIFTEPGHFTFAMFGRLLIPSIEPHFDKIIYADIDIIFNQDPAELLFIDLEDNYLAAVPDSVIEKNRNQLVPGITEEVNAIGLSPSDKYINTGLLVFNIRAWIDYSLMDKILNFLVGKKLNCPDQDAINAICKGKIHFLPSKWNTFNIKEHLNNNFFCDSAVIHYASYPKVWNDPTVFGAEIWWSYARKVSNYEQLIWRSCIRRIDWRFSKRAIIEYRVLGLRLLVARVGISSIRYDLFGFKSLRIGKLIVKKNERSVFVFGIKLFSKKIK